MRLRPLIAVLTAYALALQVLLAGVGAALAPANAGDAFDLSVICHTDQEESPAAPGAKHTHQSCCILCGVSLLSVPPPSSQFVAYPRIAGRWIVPPRALALAAPHLSSPRQSRGPPHAA